MSGPESLWKRPRITLKSLFEGLNHFEIAFWGLESLWKDSLLRLWLTLKSLLEALNQFEITFWRLESLLNHILKKWFQSDSSLQKVISKWFKASKSEFQVIQGPKTWFNMIQALTKWLQSDSSPQKVISKCFCSWKLIPTWDGRMCAPGLQILLPLWWL